MKAVSGLLCILHAQFGEDMAEVCFEKVSAIQVKQDRVETDTFVIKAPIFNDSEQYSFIWDSIKTEQDPTQKFFINE